MKNTIIQLACYKYSSSVAAFCRSPEVKDNLDKMTTFTVNSDE